MFRQSRQALRYRNPASGDTLPSVLGRNNGGGPRRHGGLVLLQDTRRYYPLDPWQVETRLQVNEEQSGNDVG